MSSTEPSKPSEGQSTVNPETPEPELTQDERRSERQRLKEVRKARRKEVKKNAYNGKNRAMGKQAKGKKR